MTPLSTKNKDASSLPKKNAFAQAGQTTTIPTGIITGAELVFKLKDTDFSKSAAIVSYPKGNKIIP